MNWMESGEKQRWKIHKNLEKKELIEIEPKIKLKPAILGAPGGSWGRSGGVLGYLGGVLERLRVPRGRLGASWGPLGALLGAS